MHGGSSWPSGTDQAAASRRVLVVEDHADSAQCLATVLELWGHRVCVAREGSEALGVVERFRPEIVLLDLNLPDMDGSEVARRLRAGAGAEPPLLVAYSGYDPGTPHGPDRDDFDRLLSKPVDLDALKNLLDDPRLTGPEAGAVG